MSKIQVVVSIRSNEDGYNSRRVLDEYYRSLSKAMEVYDEVVNSIAIGCLFTASVRHVHPSNGKIYYFKCQHDMGNQRFGPFKRINKNPLPWEGK